MFERRHEPLVPRPIFAWRMLRASGASFLLVMGSLGIGAVGYHWIEGLRWIDSIYAAAMILTGMGPTCELKTDSAKIFVTCYALFSGLVFLSAGALVLTPFLHRVLHKFHLKEGAHDERP